MHTAWPAAGFPIRIFPVQSLMTASRDFSQSSTSFIGSICQGIHFVPLSTFLCIDWIGSWIFNSKVGVNLPSILTLVEKDIRYCSSIWINKYLNEITNINLIILRLKHKLLNYCACHTCRQLPNCIRITSIVGLMMSRTVVVECTFETSIADIYLLEHLKSLSAFYSTIYYSKLCLVCKHSTA